MFYGMKRRTFITTGFVSLTAITVGINLSSTRLLDPQQTYMTADHIELFSVLLPVLLNGALPVNKTAQLQSLQKTLNAMGNIIAQLEAQQYQELLRLLDLLNSRLGCLFLTAELTPLVKRTPLELAKMLIFWRTSFMDFHQQAYIGLRELVFSSFYSLPEHWHDISYSKPSL